MAPYLLIPASREKPSGDPGTAVVMDGKTAMPEEWRPRVEDLSPYAYQPNLDSTTGSKADARDTATSYPTPFFRMEATKAAISAGTGEYWEAWSIAVRALAAGILRVRTWDLERDAGEFGKRLALLDSNRKFTAMLSATVSNKERVFAVVDPDVLLWPAARRTRDEWNVLSALVQPEDANARQVLADFKAIVAGGRQWTDAIPWMRGLSKLLGNLDHSQNLKTWAENVRTEGPFALRLQDGDHQAISPVYFPHFEKGWGSRVRRLATLSFEATPDKLAMEARDRRGLPVFRIPILSDAVPLAATYKGSGTVCPVPGATPDWPSWQNITLSQPNGLFAALRGRVYSDTMDCRLISERPYGYPDPLRILVAALGPVGLPPNPHRHGFVFGSGAISRALEHGIPLPNADSISESDGFILQGDQIYLERADLGITELREIGWVLWETFVGNGQVTALGNEAVVEIAGETALRVPNGGRLAIRCSQPLDADYRSDVRKRAAALQRFAKAWSLASRPPFMGDILPDLFRAAAYTWVLWVTERPPFPNGPLFAHPKTARKLPLKIGQTDMAQLHLDIE